MQVRSLFKTLQENMCFTLVVIAYGLKVMHHIIDLAVVAEKHRITFSIK